MTVRKFQGRIILPRRLSLAASDLIYTDDKVIDIAIKYCYDTPESFARAFSRFHGITPTAAKFPYGIGVEYDGRPLESDELEIVEIPAHTYAVFTCKVKMPDAFVDTYKKIVSGLIYDYLVDSVMNKKVGNKFYLFSKLNIE